MQQSNIVVYKSEGERVFDQWLWHGGGWEVVLWIALLFLLVVLFYVGIDYVSKPAHRRPRLW